MSHPAFFPGWLRAAHLVNIIFITFLMRSGLQILSAFPRLYWTDNCRPGIEWIKFTRTRVPRGDPDALYKRYAAEDAEEKEHEKELEKEAVSPALGRRALIWGLAGLVYVGLLIGSAATSQTATSQTAARQEGDETKKGRSERASASLRLATALLAAKPAPRQEPRIYTSLEEELDMPPWLSLPGHKNLGLGRHWHFISDLIWILNGLVFVILVVVSGYWRYYVPTSWAIIPEAAQSAWTYLHFNLAPTLPGQPFNALQKLAYFFIVFILAPFQIATGAAMSPALAARFPWYIKLFGGRQKARSLHFIGLLIFIGFVIVHTVMVIVHDFPYEAGFIIWGRPEYRVATVFVALAAIAGIVLIQVAATHVSLRHPRGTQRVLGRATHALVQQLLFSREGSREEYPRADIAPYFWANGHPPVNDAYLALVRDDFADWRLEVGGLVERPLRLSLDDLRAMPKETQITKHNCIQGWSDVAAWGGVSVAHIMELCQPRPNARYVVFHAMDDKALRACLKNMRPALSVLASQR